MQREWPGISAPRHLPTMVGGSCVPVSMTEKKKTEKRRQNKKKKAMDTCDVKCKWTEDEIRKSITWFTGKSVTLQKECEAHGVSQNGDMKRMRVALRKHFPTQRRTRRSRARLHVRRAIASSSAAAPNRRHGPPLGVEEGRGANNVVTPRANMRS